MLSVENRNFEFTQLHKFFSESEVLAETLECIEYDKPEEKFINEFKAIVAKEYLRIDPLLPVTSIRIPYKDLENVIMHTYELQFENRETGKVVTMNKKDVAFLAIVADPDTKHIQILRDSRNICRSEHHKAISLDKENNYDTTIVNAKGTLDKYLAINRGICILAVISMNFTNSDLSIKEEETIAIRKFLNLFSKKTQITNNMKTYVTLYFCQWEKDLEDRNIYDYSDEEFEDYLEAKDIPKMDHYPPVCDKEPEDIKGAIETICKSGVGEIKFTITGFKTEISNRRKEKFL